MSIVQYLLTVLSFGTLGLLLVRGRAPERWAAVALLVAMVGTPLVDGWYVAGVRLGVAMLGVALFASLLSLALTVDRWWLMAATGVQLLSVGSWLLALLKPETQLWAGVTFRLLIWAELMILACLGVWEARRAPYAQPLRRTQPRQ
jgi:hypothetical protein